MVDLAGDQGQDMMIPMKKKKSCVVRLAKMAMLDKIINKAKEEEGAEVKRTEVVKEEVADRQDKVDLKPVADMSENLLTSMDNEGIERK